MSATLRVPDDFTAEDLELAIEHLEVERYRPLDLSAAERRELKNLKERERKARTRGEAWRNFVPTADLRAWFEREGLTASDIAVRMEWRTKDGFLDTHRVNRTLGLRPYHTGKGMTYKQRVSYGVAVRLVIAMGADPVDFDL